MRVAFDAALGEAEDADAVRDKDGVPCAVLLELRAGAVEVPAVGLDDKAKLRPIEVDELSKEQDVALRARGVLPCG